jgi:hypothetical protein
VFSYAGSRYTEIKFPSLGGEEPNTTGDPLEVRQTGCPTPATDLFIGVDSVRPAAAFGSGLVDFDR